MDFEKRVTGRMWHKGKKKKKGNDYLLLTAREAVAEKFKRGKWKALEKTFHY